MELQHTFMFCGLPDAWELPTGKDRAKILEAVAEYARLWHVHNWQWPRVDPFDDYHGAFDELLAFFSMGERLYHQEWVSWLQRKSVQPRLRELEKYLLDELYDEKGNVDLAIRIHLPGNVIQKLENHFLGDMLHLYHVIQGLHDLNAFAELANTKDAFCVDALSTLVQNFVQMLRQVIQPDPETREEAAAAMHVSDFTGLNLVDIVRKAQTILFESEGTLRLFQLLRWDEDLSNPGNYIDPFPHLWYCFDHYDEEGHLTKDHLAINVSGNLYNHTPLAVGETAIVEVYHDKVFHILPKRGYVYGPVQMPPAFRILGKAWLRWDKPAFLNLDSYPAELESEFLVAIGYDDVFNREQSTHATG